MTHQRKKDICQILASLFSPPDREMAEQVHQGTLYFFFQHSMDSWGKNNGLLNGFQMDGGVDVILKELEDEYGRLFSYLTEDSISLVESFYKPWTQDPHCLLPFASETGLLMGDSALHMSAIYEQCGLEVSNEFKGNPDHLVIELELLSYLYRWVGDAEIKKFIEDHLDWTRFLESELRRLHPHAFYTSALGVLNLFLDQERKRLEVGGNGKKKIH